MYPSSPASSIAFLTLFKASSLGSSSSPSPATLTISNALKTGCFLNNLLNALASETPGRSQKECLNKFLYFSLAKG